MINHHVYKAKLTITSGSLYRGSAQEMKADLRKRDCEHSEGLAGFEKEQYVYITAGNIQHNLFSFFAPGMMLQA